MGCGTSRVKPVRSTSQVTIESHQRTVAAYRRQRIARDMEQTAYLRAEAEVEKALMLKRCSIDERRPSYIQRVLEDLEEVEEGQEETEEEDNPTITIDSASEVDLMRGHSNLMYSTTEHASNEDDEHNRKLSVPVKDDVEILTENPNISESTSFNEENDKLEQYFTNHNKEEEQTVRDQIFDSTENGEKPNRNVTLDSIENAMGMTNDLETIDEEASSLYITPQLDKVVNQSESESENMRNENRVNENLEHRSQEYEEALDCNMTSITTNPLAQGTELEATDIGPQTINVLKESADGQAVENEDKISTE